MDVSSYSEGWISNSFCVQQPGDFMESCMRRGKTAHEGGALFTMKIKNQKIYACLLFLSLAVILLFPGQVRAEERSCTISIPAETAVSGKSAPSGTEFEIVLEALDKECPMPETTNVTVKDSGKVKFGPITYTVPEDYHYRVYQKAGNAKNYTYDKTEYTVTVRVVNAENGGLSAEIWAIKDGSQNKTDRIVFNNSYKAPADPAVSNVKTGDTVEVYVWVGLFVAALAAVLLVLAVRRRRAKSE